jgi:hypothetical protein
MFCRMSPLLILLPWRWRQHVPPKRRFVINPHGATWQKTAFFKVYYVPQNESFADNAYWLYWRCSKEIDGSGYELPTVSMYNLRVQQPVRPPVCPPLCLPVLSVRWPLTQNTHAVAAGMGKKPRANGKRATRRLGGRAGGNAIARSPRCERLRGQPAALQNKGSQPHCVPPPSCQFQ